MVLVLDVILFTTTIHAQVIATFAAVHSIFDNFRFPIGARSHKRIGFVWEIRWIAMPYAPSRKRIIMSRSTNLTPP
ncbi:hypothetical protein EI94DRAFT_1741167 [Lactarius quietus]|nr:hypothetical protein EI94DRAFT_1741167 [Lactarius quietus]